MVDIISAAELASYLRNDDLATNASLEQIVEFTNELVTEEWVDPIDPVPVKVKLLTLNVAARAWVYDPSRSHIESYSRSLDDASRTERYRSSSDHQGVYLTDSEIATLNGRARSNSLRLTIYGQT